MHKTDQNHHAQTEYIAKFVQLHFIASNKNSGYCGYWDNPLMPGGNKKVTHT